MKQEHNRQVTCNKEYGFDGTCALEICLPVRQAGNMVYSIVANEDMVWFATDKGLCRIDKNTISSLFK
jgi:hypothetical protein